MGNPRYLFGWLIEARLSRKKKPDQNSAEPVKQLWYRSVSKVTSNAKKYLVCSKFRNSTIFRGQLQKDSVGKAKINGQNHNITGTQFSRKRKEFCGKSGV